MTEGVFAEKENVIFLLNEMHVWGNYRGLI